jgi:hypothetical protein
LFAFGELIWKRLTGHDDARRSVDREVASAQA